MKPRWRWLAAATAILALLALPPLSGQVLQDGEAWTPAELAILKSLRLSALEPAAPDPSNAYERAPAAAALGKRIFFDPRFSANRQVSCASCHDPARGFQDDRALGQGVGIGLRRTMPIVESGRGPWLFWDGRKDSMWSQALGPMEDAREHGGNRLDFVRVVAQHYRNEYEAVFAALPRLEGLPAAASPLGSQPERDAWRSMSAADQQAVSRVFANIGKAIAAYERTLAHAPAPIDRYIEATLAKAPDAGQLLAPAEKRGLRLFIGKAGCVSCHAGPLLTDSYFHNTGVKPRRPGAPDRGRAAAIDQVRSDEFNCLGPYSDAAPEQCQELNFMAADDPLMLGAFKTPSLRNVAQRAPFMHAGQLATLADVIDHYASAPRAAVGRNERRPTELSERERQDLLAFMGTLTGGIQEKQ